MTNISQPPPRALSVQEPVPTTLEQEPLWSRNVKHTHTTALWRQFPTRTNTMDTTPIPDPTQLPPVPDDDDLMGSPHPILQYYHPWHLPGANLLCAN